MTEKGYINNCYIACRVGSPTLFSDNGDGTVTPRLDGYAVVPLEEYEKHVERASKMAELNDESRHPEG